MSAAGFIAKRLFRRDNYPGEEDSLSGISRNIAWISIALSILVIIVAVSVTEGFRLAIRDKATGFVSSIVLTVPGQGPVNEQNPFNRNLSYIDSVKALPGVVSVCPVACRSGMLRSGEGISGIFFKGVDSLYDFSFFKSSLTEGSLPDFSGRISSDILISSRLARQMGYSVGDKLTCYFIGDKIKVRSFRLCGVFDARLEEIDNTFAIIDIRQVQRLASWSYEDVSSIEIRLSPESDIDEACLAVEAIQNRCSGEGDAPLFVRSVKLLCSNLFDWLHLLDFNVAMILALMVAVAAFNMMSCLLILVFRHISSIGILKSLGMRNWRITAVFLRHSSLLMGKGLLAGNAVALLLCFLQKKFEIIRLDPANYFVDCVPVNIDLLEILAIDLVSFAVILCILSLCSLFISGISPDRTMRVD